MQRRLGSTTLSQLVIPGGKQPEFSTGEIPVGQYSCLKKSYERWGGACMGYPKRVDAISNWTQRNETSTPWLLLFYVS